MILAVTERQSAGGLTPASREVVAAAQGLGTELGLPVAAVVLEAADDGSTAALTGYALQRVLLARHAALGVYDPEVWVQALVQIATQAGARWVLLPHSYRSRDFAPRLATRMGGGLVSDVTAMRVVAGEPHFTRPLFQGKLAAEVRLRGNGAGFATLQVGAFAAEPAAVGKVPVKVEEIAVTPSASRLTPGPVTAETPAAVELTQAAAIVAVGRGIKDPKHLEMMRELAAALGAELGASRPVCDAGWLPMQRQVGSSGQTVAPKLYLAVGISGAIQHVIGIRGARTIVAINQDPAAPIFEVADYGVVGNLFEVVPALIAALQAPG